MSLFGFIKFCLVYFEVALLGAFKFRIVIAFWRCGHYCFFVFKFILSGFNIICSACLYLIFAWHLFFYPLFQPFHVLSLSVWLVNSTELDSVFLFYFNLTSSTWWMIHHCCILSLLICLNSPILVLLLNFSLGQFSMLLFLLYCHWLDGVKFPDLFFLLYFLLSIGLEFMYLCNLHILYLF